jgi:membrane protease YdiL (CAAX protease family)
MAALGIAPTAVRQRGPLHQVRQLVRRHPLFFYFLIAYAFTWTYDLLFLVLFPLPDDLPRSAPRDLGPSLAALVVTATVGGKPGLRDLGRRLVRWRVHPVWYLLAFVGVPVVYVLGILLVPGALASFTVPPPGRWLLYPVLFLFIVVFGGPLFEEPGWRGFALPRLQQRWGPLAGSVILGVLWATWHATEYLTPEFAAANGGLTLPGVATFLVAAVCFSVLITWVCNHTRASILLAVLVHAAINWSQGWTSEVFAAAAFNETGPLVAFGVAALVLVVATRGRLGYVGPGAGAEGAEGAERGPSSAS